VVFSSCIGSSSTVVSIVPCKSTTITKHFHHTHRHSSLCPLEVIATPASLPSKSDNLYQAGDRLPCTIHSRSRLARPSRTCGSLSVLQTNASTATLPESTLSDGKALRRVEKSLEEERGVILHKSAHNSQIIFNARGWYSACAIDITLSPISAGHLVHPVNQPPPTQPTCKASQSSILL
jgi:hypothetical protein